MKQSVIRKDRLIRIHPEIIRIKREKNISYRFSSIGMAIQMFVESENNKNECLL